MAVVLGAATALALVPAGAANAAGSFWDDDGDTHERQIEGLSAAEVTKGCDPPANSQYCGFDDVERGQMAAFIDRATDLPPASRDHFTDDEDSIFEDEINRLAEAGITDGCNPPDNDEYCPDDVVRRDQMAKFLSLAFDVPRSDDDAFTDDDGSIFEELANGIEDAGITVGCNPPANDRYCPDDVVRRNEMASFLTRADDDIDPIDPASLHEQRVTYTVDGAENTLQNDVELLERRAEEALYAELGWNIRHRLLIEEVEDEADFSIVLAEGATIERQAPGCSDDFSCTVGDVIYIHEGNFDDRPQPWSDRTQAEYQRYLVLHETGHFLDFDDTAEGDSHYNGEQYCVDGDAPVMKQQSITTGDCDTNVFPLPFERDCVEESWLPDTTDQGDGDGDDDDQCPHEPDHRPRSGASTADAEERGIDA